MESSQVANGWVSGSATVRRRVGESPEGVGDDDVGGEGGVGVVRASREDEVQDFGRVWNTPGQSVLIVPRQAWRDFWEHLATRATGLSTLFSLYVISGDFRSCVILKRILCG